MSRLHEVYTCEERNDLLEYFNIFRVIATILVIFILIFVYKYNQGLYPFIPLLGILIGFQSVLITREKEPDFIESTFISNLWYFVIYF